MRRYTALLMGVVLSSYLAHSLTAPPGQGRSGPGPVPTTVVARGQLPVVGTRANLVRLLRQLERERVAFFAAGGGVVAEVAAAGGEASMQGAPPAGSAQAAEAQGPAAEQPAPGFADYSRTNVQVEGVDEADLVKTDGRHIYQVNGSRLLVIRARPPEELTLTAAVDLSREGLEPLEMYLADDRLVVIGHAWLPRSQFGVVRVLVYDVSAPDRPRRVREAEVEGRYLSSRRIGSALYLVANRPADYETPVYRDSAAGGAYVSPGYEEVRYFPGFTEPNYLVVAGLDLDRPEQPLAVDVYLGAGQTVYASRENLYVAVTAYGHPVPAGGPGGTGGPSPDTVIHRFSLEGGRAVYRATGRVPGTVLNQFSLDEHGGFLRVATTRGEVWAVGRAAADNNLYVLDGDLNVVGRLEGIAPGERIYSARFLGDRAYLVTFKKVDPFFVLDLSEPRTPRVLGYLKIPGYSDYLHPYDENHVLGFGKDTVEGGDVGKPAPWDVGKPAPWGAPGDPGLAFYQGLKVALFDVRDVAHPVEKFRVIIGDRSTDSELLRNHRALLFSRERGLLALPVTLHQVHPAVRAADPLAYGRLTFQGLYVFSLDPERGFDLRGRVTHLTETDRRRLGEGWYSPVPLPPGTQGEPGDPSRRFVERALYIGDTLYALSQRRITAHDLAGLTEVGSLELPAP